MDFKQQAANAIIWIDGLLSGKHKQAKKKLGDSEGGFCCWGLGCFLTGVEYDSERGWSNGLDNDVGWGEFSGRIVGGAESLLNAYNLADANDNEDKTFPQIGHALKTYPEEAFLPEVASLIREHYSSVGELSVPAE